MQPISPNYLRENGVKKIKSAEENLSQSCILCSIAKDKDPSSSVKMHQTFFVGIFTTISCIPAEWM